MFDVCYVCGRSQDLKWKVKLDRGNVSICHWCYTHFVESDHTEQLLNCASDFMTIREQVK